MSKSPVRTMYVYLYRLKRSMGGYKRGEGYVGQAVDPVKRDKQHSNAKNARNFERVLRELGRENFSFNVVAQCECWPHGPKINALENEMMAKCGTFRRESGRGWNFSRANSYELGSVEQLESVHAARKAANQRKAKDPKWLAANKAANQRKAKDPKWLERNRAQNCRTMQDPEVAVRSYSRTSTHETRPEVASSKQGGKPAQGERPEVARENGISSS